MPDTHKPAGATRCLDLQEGCLHAGWRDVLPCRTSIVAVYEALEAGNLHLPVQYASERQAEPVFLQQLAQLPLQVVIARLSQSTGACVNALAFTQADGDACHLSMLRHTGTGCAAGNPFRRDVLAIDSFWVLYQSRFSLPTFNDAACAMLGIKLQPSDRIGCNCAPGLHSWKPLSMMLARPYDPMQHDSDCIRGDKRESCLTQCLASADNRIVGRLGISKGLRNALCDVRQTICCLENLLVVP